LQVSAQQTVTHGFSIQGFYVWSKSLQSEALDTTGNTGNSATTEPQDNRNRYLDRQRSDFDQRHVSAISFVYKPKLRHPELCHAQYGQRLDGYLHHPRPERQPIQHHHGN
jgi:hypothetical protein